MEYATQKEIQLHNRLIKYLAGQHIKHGQENPKTEDVLAMYNRWPERYLCRTVEEVSWAVTVIRHAFTVAECLWREALQIDGFIV